MPRRAWWAIATVVAALGAFLSFTSKDAAVAVMEGSVTRVESLRSLVTASGEIVAARYADIGSPVMGRLVALTVKEGDAVRAGQVLARIDAIQATATADAAAAALSALEADAGAAVTQVRAAQSSLDEARSRATEAETALTRATQLREAGLLPAAEFDRTVATTAAAKAQQAAVAAAAEKAEQAATAAERRVAQARAERDRARDQLDKTEITAPIDGVVTRLDVAVGEMVVVGVQNQPGTILMTVSDLTAIDAEVKVAEADVMRLDTGMTATITLEALTGQRFSGRIVEIGASALPQIGATAAAREFRVKVRLTGTAIPLRPGLTCDVEIQVAERRGALAAPLQAVVERDGRPGVFGTRGGAARFLPVTTGIIGGLQIEIDGVPEGTSIAIGPMQVLRDLQDGAFVRAADRR